MMRDQIPMLALHTVSCYNEQQKRADAGRTRKNQNEEDVQMNFFGGNFQAWKLHTLEDYLYLLAFILVGVAFFAMVIRHMNKQRNHEKALRKVIKRLRRLAGRPSRIYEKATFRFPDGPQAFDAVLADKSGIYLVKTYGWGIKIYGTPDGENWRREDPKRKEEFPNPLPELKAGAEKIREALSKQGIGQVKIMPMVVFADNYQTPELYLGYGSFSTTYQELKSWYKKQASVKEAQYDFERVSSILEELSR